MKNTNEKQFGCAQSSIALNFVAYPSKKERKKLKDLFILANLFVNMLITTIDKLMPRKASRITRLIDKAARKYIIDNYVSNVSNPLFENIPSRTRRQLLTSLVGRINTYIRKCGLPLSSLHQPLIRSIENADKLLSAVSIENGGTSFKIIFHDDIVISNLEPKEYIDGLILSEMIRNNDTVSNIRFKVDQTNDKRKFIVHIRIPNNLFEKYVNQFNIDDVVGISLGKEYTNCTDTYNDMNDIDSDVLYDTDDDFYDDDEDD